MNFETRSSDEILNELYYSLNLPISPIALNKTIKSESITESSNDSDSDASSSSHSTKETKLHKDVQKLINKQSKKKDKKKKKKLKKDNKSKHKKKKKKKVDISVNDNETKSDTKIDLLTCDSTDKIKKHLEVSEKLPATTLKQSSKELDLIKKQSRSYSKNRENHSKSKSKSRYSRSRSRSRSKPYRLRNSSPPSHRYQSYSRSQSRSPLKHEKCKSNKNRLSHSPSPRKVKHNKSRSRSPVKKELSDPLDTWRMAKLASLKSKNDIAGTSELETVKIGLETTKERPSNNVISVCEDTNSPLEAIPLPGSISKESMSDMPSEKLVERKQSYENKITEIDLTCIPIPVTEDHCNSNNTSISYTTDNKDKESLKINENISKVKEEGKSKIIVIKSLKDSLVFQQAEEAQIKKEKSIDSENELGKEVNISITADTNIVVHKKDEELSSGLNVTNDITVRNEEINRDGHKNSEKLNLVDVKCKTELDAENKKMISNKNEIKEKAYTKTRRRSRSKSLTKRSKKRSKRSYSNDRKKSRSKSESRSRSKNRKSSANDSKRSPSRSRMHRRRRSRSPSRSHSHGKSYHKKRSSYSRENSRRKKSPDCVDSLRDKATRKRLLEVARRNAVYLMKNNCLPPSIEKESVKATGKSVEELTSFCKQLVAKEEFSDQELSDPSLSPDEEADSLHDKPFGTSRHPFAIKDSKPILMNIRNAPMLPTKTNAERLADTSKLREQFPVSSGSQHRNKEGWVTVEKDEKVKEETVFPEVPKAEVDISSLVSTRLSAMRRLQDNPQDRDAIKALNTAQKDMQDWALSKQVPGQFTGSTGVRILSQEELASGFQAWARKEQFKEATPVSSHFGMKMLQKMGWNPGEGLGKNKEGQLEPLLLDVKMDKKGLTAQQEIAPRRISLPLAKSLAGKHPVSALMEICNKKKWGPPEFEVLFDGGPDHKKNFFMKVHVNGETYQSAIAAHTKKIAKANAAAAALQALGLVPKDPTPKPDATLNTTALITASTQVNASEPTLPALPQNAIQVTDQAAAAAVSQNVTQNLNPPLQNHLSTQPRNQFLTGPQIPQTMQPVCYPHSFGFYAGNASSTNNAMFAMRMPNMPAHSRSQLPFMSKQFHR